MDPTTLVGFLAVILILAKAIGTAPGNVVNGMLLLVVLGGGLAVSIIGFRKGDWRVMFALPFRVLISPKWDFQELIMRIVGYAETARREGILALEQAAREDKDPFAATGIRLAVDGTVPELIQSIMQTELAYIEERHRNGQRLFAVLGMSWILFGLIGTAGVLALGRGGGVEAALPLFYGLVLAGVIAGPIWWKARTLSEMEIRYKQMTINGLLAIQAGDNPRIIEQKLQVCVAPRERIRKKQPAEQSVTKEPVSVDTDFHTQVRGVIGKLQTGLPDELVERPNTWTVEELLGLVEDQTRQDILRLINEPEVVPKLPSYDFEVLAQLSDREVQMIMREIGFRDLSMALLGASDAVRELIFRNISQRVATMIKETMNSRRAQSATVRQVVDKQLYILRIVQMLQEKNQVKIP